MRTKTFLCVMITSLLVISSVSSYSQGFGFGMRFGMTNSHFSNWSKLLQDDFVGSSDLNPGKVGLQTSFVLNPMFSKMFGLEIELNYEQKGFTMKNYDGNDELQYKATYNYFVLPILFKGGYSIGMFSVYGMIGPYVGFALSGKEKYYENGNVKDEFTVEFGEGELPDDANGITGGPRGWKANRLDVGLTFGIQPGVRLGPGDLVVDFRYSWGFMDLDNPTAGQIADYNDYANAADKLPYYSLCNRSMGLSIGYIFRFGAPTE